jgi:metal-responsive CopG/Arc/MetJ family transcriptional regulator
MAKMTKVLISMPPELVKKLDAEAKRRGMSRSALVRWATTSELLRRRPTQAERAALVEQIRKGAERREARRGDREFDSTAAIRWDRDHGHSV